MSSKKKEKSIKQNSIFTVLNVHHICTYTSKSTCTQASVDLRHCSWRTGTAIHTYIRLQSRAFCSADEWVGPQQGPPVLSWSPPVLAASDSLQSSTTSQPPHCKQTEYVERILTAASKAPAYVWQQFINILFYCVCWSNHRHRCGGPYWQEIDTEFIFHILTKCVCCCILCSHWHAWRKNIVSLKPPLFSWATCKAKANIRFSVMTNAGFISTSFWLRDLSKQSSPNGLQRVIMTLCQRLENYWWTL